MKTLLSAIVRLMPWPYRRLGTSSHPKSASADLLASGIVGLAIGAISAAIFLAASLVLPTRVALMAGLLAGMAASLPRPSLVGWAQTLSPMSVLALGMVVLAKLEILSEIDLEWIAVTMVCSSAFGRAAILAARRQPMVQMSEAHGMARVACLVIGMLPLAAFGIWPEPVWGLWVAAGVTLLSAAVIKGRRWAAPMAVRYALAETIFCLCVLVLMGAAAITSMHLDEAEDS